MELKFEQSDTELYTPAAGLCFVGHNNNTCLKKSLRSIKKRHGIPNIDLIRAFVGLLALGKNDFDAIDNYRHDDWFKRSMGIKQMPSASRLRQRFNEDATQLIPVNRRSISRAVDQTGSSNHSSFKRSRSSSTHPIGYRCHSSGQQQDQKRKLAMDLQTIP